MNKIEIFDDVFKRHKIDLNKPVFSTPIVIEMMDDAIREAAKEWQLSEKAHDITIEQLRTAQDARNRWREMCIKLAEEMRSAEWDSPLYWEYQKLRASYETGNS